MVVDRSARIFLAGHNGMVGSATLAVLKNAGFSNVLTQTSAQLDLINQQAVYDWFASERPEIVILAAAKVGGIQANIAQPGTFLFNNLMIQNNVIHAAFKNNVHKLVFLGSSCIYPRESPQPMKEEYMLTGKLEPTNESYAIARIAGIKMLESYHKEYGFNSISLMPCNLYGPNDSFDLNHSHVLSALIRRFTDAKAQGTPEITLWGTGSARRELMHVNDMARAVLFFLENYDSPEFINVGWGDDISIKELAEKLATATGYEGTIKWDTSKPDGMPRKCMEVSRMKKLGFEPQITLDQGIREMMGEYEKWKLKNPS